jgi:hypothetical protein
MLEALAILIGAYIGQLPDEPNDLLLLNWAGGSSPIRELGVANATMIRPTIQLRVRATSYYTAFNNLRDAIEIIDGYSGVLGDETVLLIQQSSDIMPMGRDVEDRYEFSINFNVILDRSDL